MRAALALAERGLGRTQPNPSVGCVIVKDGVVLGRGWTQPGGRPHAEAMALAQAGTLAQAGEAARDATVYVTLEPCAHESPRGPSCTSLLLAARPARVVIAALDPDPRTSGHGALALQRAGIEVVSGVLEAEAVRQQRGFRLRLAEGRPEVTLKLATSLDGRIALPNGESRWITGPEARRHAHLERARHDVILIGRRTLETDDPMLDVRLPGLEDRSPRPVVVSRTLERIAPSLKLAGRAEVLSGASLPEMLAGLAAGGALRVLAEGGAGLAASLLRHDLVDRLLWYTAPIVLGDGRSGVEDLGLARLAEAHGRWRTVDSLALGEVRLAVFERIR